jgi:hypothetical protein
MEILQVIEALAVRKQEKTKIASYVLKTGLNPHELPSDL